MMRKIIKISLVLCLIFVGGCRGREFSNSSEVAVTNTYLECAVKDLLGMETSVMRLSGPGMCPGHFDIRPSQLTELRSCRMLLRFDFQKSLDTKLVNACDKGLEIAVVKIPGGLCEPESYLSACRQVAAILTNFGMLEHQKAELRIKEIESRINEKTSSCRQQIIRLEAIPVIASIHQLRFCKWLGLNVIDTFRGSDVESVGQVNQAISKGLKANVKLVIANLPEGRRVADALAQRLGAKVVVFENFPALDIKHSSFDDLLQQNVRELLKAVKN